MANNNDNLIKINIDDGVFMKFLDDDLKRLFDRKQKAMELFYKTLEDSSINIFLRDQLKAMMPTVETMKAEMFLDEYKKTHVEVLVNLLVLVEYLNGMIEKRFKLAMVV